MGAMAVPQFASLAASVAGGAAVMAWRVQETRSPVSLKKIVVPPMGMSTGFAMFLAPMFRVPWTWGAAAFLTGALALAYPLLRTSRLIRDGDAVTLERSNAFLAVLVGLFAVRLAARSYLDTVLSLQQTSALFFVLAFGMVVRWRLQMLLEYRALVAAPARD